MKIKDKLKKIKLARLTPVEKYIIDILNNLEYIHTPKLKGEIDIYHYNYNIIFWKDNDKNVIYVENKIWVSLHEFKLSDGEVIKTLRYLLKNQFNWIDYDFIPFGGFSNMNKKLKENDNR